MFQQPLLFPAVSNRESFVQTVQLCDDETGDLISLTDTDDDVIYQIFLEICPPRDHHHGGSGYSENYNSYDSWGGARILATLDDYLSVVDTGTINVQIPYTVMQKLHGNKTYDIYMRLEDQVNDDARQLFIGKLPILFGGHGI